MQHLSVDIGKMFIFNDMNGMKYGGNRAPKVVRQRMGWDKSGNLSVCLALIPHLMSNHNFRRRKNG
jgi:hypothetical protein